MVRRAYRVTLGMVNIPPRVLSIIGLSALLAIGAAGCGGSDDDVVVYSGRNEELIGPLLERFEKETGIGLKVNYGDSAEAAKLLEEGGRTKADVFIAQDAGALGSVATAGLLSPLAPAQLDKVSPRFRDAQGRWVGLSGRSRVIAWSTDRLKAEDVPGTVFDLTDPRWKGRVCMPPSNASFQAFISSMRLAAGEDRARQWLDQMKGNDPVFRGNNIECLDSIINGETDLALVNHYYLYNRRRELGSVPVENKYLAGEDPGALVNVAGAGIVGSTDKRADAERLIDFLLSPEAQQYFRDETAEYPLADGVTPLPELPPLDSLQGPDIDLNRLGTGDFLRQTQQLLTDAGYLG